MKRVVGVISLVLLLPSCVQQNVRKREGGSFDWAVIQARYPDIPVPLSSTIDVAHSAIDHENQKIVCVFTVQQSCEQLIRYYRQQMELCGWVVVTVFDITEQCAIQCKKPTKLCTVLCEPHRDGSKVSVFIGPRLTK